MCPVPILFFGVKSVLDTSSVIFSGNSVLKCSVHQDADSQRKTAKNYRFAWDPDMVTDMEAELKSMEEDGASAAPADSLYDINEDKSGGLGTGWLIWFPFT